MKIVMEKLYRFDSMDKLVWRINVWKKNCYREYYNELDYENIEDIEKHFRKYFVVKDFQ